jgi:hypothetical protein
MGLKLRAGPLPPVVHTGPAGPSEEIEPGTGSEGPKGPQMAFINKKSDQIVEPQQVTKIIGSCAFVAFVLLIAYIYGTARRRLSLYNFTFSEALKFCKKRISIVLLILFLFLLQILFREQNFYTPDNDFKRTLVVTSSYIVLTAWLLLFYVYESEFKLHSVIALFILGSMIFMIYTIYEIYLTYYTEEGLEILRGITYTCLIIAGIAIVIGLINVVTIVGFHGTGHFVTFGLIELLIIILFGIYVMAFSLLPPLPNNGDFVCFLKPDSDVLVAP